MTDDKWESCGHILLARTPPKAGRDEDPDREGARKGPGF